MWYESKLQGKITVCTEYGGGGMCHAADYDNLLAGAQTAANDRCMHALW